MRLHRHASWRWPGCFQFHLLRVHREKGWLVSRGQKLLSDKRRWSRSWFPGLYSKGSLISRYWMRSNPDLYCNLRISCDTGCSLGVYTEQSRKAEGQTEDATSLDRCSEGTADNGENVAMGWRWIFCSLICSIRIRVSFIHRPQPKHIFPFSRFIGNGHENRVGEVEQPWLDSSARTNQFASQLRDNYSSVDELNSLIRNSSLDELSCSTEIKDHLDRDYRRNNTC